MQKKDSLCNIFATTKSLRKPIKNQQTIPEENLLEIAFNETNYRLKSKNDYVPKFNSINVYLPSKDNKILLPNELNSMKQK